jgi:hypothetical protein
VANWPGRIKSHSDTQSKRVENHFPATFQKTFRVMARLPRVLVGLLCCLGCGSNVESPSVIGFSDVFEELLSGPPNSVYRLSDVTSFDWNAVVVIPGMATFGDVEPFRQPCEIPGWQPDPEIVLVVFCRDGAAPLEAVAGMAKVEAEFYRVYGPDTTVRVDDTGAVTFVDPSEGETGRDLLTSTIEPSRWAGSGAIVIGKIRATE